MKNFTTYKALNIHQRINVKATSLNCCTRLSRLHGLVDYYKRVLPEMIKNNVSIYASLSFSPFQTL